MQGQAVCNTETGYWQIFKWCCYLLRVHKTWKAVIKEVTKAGQTKRSWLLEHGISQNHGVQSSLKHFLVQVSIWGLNSLNVIPAAHLSTLLTLFSEGSIQRNLLHINSKNVCPLTGTYQLSISSISRTLDQSKYFSHDLHYRKMSNTRLAKLFLFQATHSHILPTLITSNGFECLQWDCPPGKLQLVQVPLKMWQSEVNRISLLLPGPYSKV